MSISGISKYVRKCRKIIVMKKDLLKWLEEQREQLKIETIASNGSDYCRGKRIMLESFSEIVKLGEVTDSYEKMDRIEVVNLLKKCVELIDELREPLYSLYDTEDLTDRTVDFIDDIERFINAL